MTDKLRALGLRADFWKDIQRADIAQELSVMGLNNSHITRILEVTLKMAVQEMVDAPSEQLVRPKYIGERSINCLEVALARLALLKGPNRDLALIVLLGSLS